jgi:hypothetical protein
MADGADERERSREHADGDDGESAATVSRTPLARRPRQHRGTRIERRRTQARRESSRTLRIFDCAMQEIGHGGARCARTELSPVQRALRVAGNARRGCVARTARIVCDAEEIRGGA